MLEELEVAAEVEVEESVETEDQEEITVNREEDDHEQMTITRKHENHLIYDRHPMSPYEYFKQYVPDALFNLMSDSTNIYAMQSGTLGFKPSCSGEIRTLIDLSDENPLCVMSY